MWLKIKSNERALILRRGIAVALLGPGDHWFWRKFSFELFNTNHIVTSWTAELDRVLSSNDGIIVNVKDQEVALIRVDGSAYRVLETGKYIVWTSRRDVKVEVLSVRDLVLDIADEFWNLMPSNEVAVKVVRPYESVLVYVDGVLSRPLEAGRYLISRFHRSVLFETFDMREQELQVSGQDLMTADKVSIRINLILKYRIIDAIKASQKVKNLDASLYAILQIAARNFISGVSVDELLEARNKLSEAMFESVSEEASGWGVEVIRADLKDVILPGDMKLILNQVISAEKRSQANLIIRREETAATRSLANTAKMFEKNPMMLRLKELETMQAMTEGVDKLTFVSSKEKFLDLL